jgi:hypothetical protein
LDVAALKSPIDAASELMIILLNGDTIGTENGPIGRSDYVGGNSFKLSRQIMQMVIAHTHDRVDRWVTGSNERV